MNACSGREFAVEIQLDDHDGGVVVGEAADWRRHAMTSSHAAVYDQNVVTRTYHYAAVARRHDVSLAPLIHRVHLRVFERLINRLIL